MGFFLKELELDEPRNTLTVTFVFFCNGKLQIFNDRVRLRSRTAIQLKPGSKPRNPPNEDAVYPAADVPPSLD